jgi:transcriptional regulator with XRE-family HTH domain
MSKKNDFIDTVNRVIGDKIFNLRINKGLSREQLAADIGVTNQQLHKYEKGSNRISVGRFLLIATALKKDPSFFLKDIIKEDVEFSVTYHQRMCLEVARNFMKIQNSDHQNAINTLIKSLTKEQEEERGISNAA